MDDVPSDQHGLLPQVQPQQRRGPAPEKRALRIAGALAVSALLAGGAALAASGRAPHRAAARGPGSRSLLETLEGTCELPEGFCNADPGREDKLSLRDCDGDGVLDPYCEDGEMLRFGFVSSKAGCQSNWPSGVCIREKEPSDNQGEFGTMAATNEITVIHFNDVYQVSGVLDRGIRRGGMSRAAHFVNQERKRNPDRTFVVFAGDALSPSVLSGLFEGEQMVDILNAMKLDAASLGNHEFDFGMDTLSERLQESKFPWLNTNLMNENGELLPGTSKYLIKEVPWAPVWDPKNVSTLKVCFFGVAYDVRATMFKDVERLSFKDVFDTAEKEVAYLKNTEKCNVVMPLTHQFSKEDCKLSELLGKNVDLILGGHDHSTEFTSVCGNAPFVKADSDLKTQWVMTLWLDESGKVESVDGRVISLTDADPFDEEIHQRVVDWEEKGAKVMDEKLGCTKVDLESKDLQLRQGEVNQANFFTDAVRAFHKTDVALINGGTMRGNKVFTAGKLTRKIVTEMHPFGNQIAKIYATGEEIRQYIDRQLDCYQATCGNFVQVSGLRYEFDLRRPKGQRLVKFTDEDGNDVGDSQQLTVAISDYMLAHSPLKKNRLYNMVTLNDAVPIVQALFAAVKAKGSECIAPKLDGRIKRIK